MSGSDGVLGLGLERVELEFDSADLERVVLAAAFLPLVFMGLVAIMIKYLLVNISLERTRQN